MSIVYALLLIAVLAALAWRTWQGQHRMRDFRGLDESAARRRRFLTWTIESFISFGLGGVLLLVLIGRAGTLLGVPPEFVAVGPALGMDAPSAPDVDLLLGMATGMLIGGLGVFAVWRFVFRRKSQPVIGNVSALFPRNGREVLAVIPLAVNAGLSEEVFFRLALPLLAAGATGSALAGMVIASITFGLMHWYQGWKGVLLTGIVGVAFFWFYLLTGSLLVPILIHAGGDVIALALRPAISLWLDGRAARRHPLTA